MKINWCFKGIQEQGSFDDAAAQNVVYRTGILSNWVHNNAGVALQQAIEASQNALSVQALNDHVNNYAAVQTSTPYISLSAGCQEYLGRSSAPRLRPALETARMFATGRGKTRGYIFRCWTITSLRSNSSIPGVSEEVRDLNLHPGFFTWHYEGEIAAKLLVPRIQIQGVIKIDQTGSPIVATWLGGGHTLMNRYFVPADAMSNLVDET